MRKIKIFVLLVLVMLVSAVSVFAQAQTGTGGNALINITNPLAVAIAASFGALGDGRAIAAACEGTARNPSAGGRIFTMMILGLALIETLVLFTFLTVALGY